MNNDEIIAKKYTDAMNQLDPYIQKQKDGTYTFILSKNEATDLDPMIVHDLLRSVAHTNYLIKEGVLDPADIV